MFASDYTNLLENCLQYPQVSNPWLWIVASDVIKVRISLQIVINTKFQKSRQLFAVSNKSKTHSYRKINSPEASDYLLFTSKQKVLQSLSCGNNNLQFWWWSKVFIVPRRGRDRFKKKCIQKYCERAIQIFT